MLQEPVLTLTEEKFMFLFQFVTRARSNSDRRKVHVSLSKKGIEALNYHNNYHKMIVSNITENIDQNDLEHFLKVFEKILENLKGQYEFLKPLPITEFNCGEKVSIIEIKGTPIVIEHFLKVFEKILENLKGQYEFLKPLPITEFNCGEKVSIIEIKGTPIVIDYFREHGIEQYTVLEIAETKEIDKIALKKADGTVLEINILDAKNLIGIKAED